MDLHSRSTINYIKDKYGFSLRKGLGQNFLIDPRPLMEMIEGSGTGSEDLVIEIGPGIGALTAEAARAAAHVTAIELDDKLIPILSETLSGHENVDVVHGDVLDVDLEELIRDRKSQYGIKGKTRIIGNLPYYITTPIVMKLLEGNIGVDSITIMTQKEVADRMKASPGGKDYGALSLMVQYRCKVEPVAKISKESFYPVPKVDSAIVNFRVLDEKPVAVEDEKLFFRCIKAGFGQRRKTLLNALSAGLGSPKIEIESILRDAEIDPGRRAETLSIEEFARLSNEMTKRKINEGCSEAHNRSDNR